MFTCYHTIFTQCISIPDDHPSHFGGVMKRCAAMFLLCLLFNPINATAWGQSPGDFRSHQSGNWSDVNSWESYGDSAWIPASAIPTTADGAITIQGGHTILVDADVSVDQVTVNPTATLAVLATKTLTVTDGADSIDITV